ncbi:CFI-box-CTERM domain-containing protein [Nitrosopumilus sp.]|uniref:CFI-box-CTERM domain-containing protein n=1 Tax=Nitrosopumilus sp. TaxID=2024843 RepID=UPI003D0D09B2
MTLVLSLWVITVVALLIPNTVFGQYSSEGLIEIIGLSNHYSVSEPVEIQVKVTDVSFDCGDLYVTIYSSDKMDVINQDGFFDQCFEQDRILPIKEHFSKIIDTSGSYVINAEMISKELKRISIEETFTVGTTYETITPEPTCGEGTIKVDGICQVYSKSKQEIKSSKFIDLKTLLPDDYQHKEVSHHEDDDYKYIKMYSGKDEKWYTVYLWQSSNPKDLPDRMNYQISQFYGNTFTEKYPGISGNCWIVHTGSYPSPESLRLAGTKSIGCISNDFAFLVFGEQGQHAWEEPIEISKSILNKMNSFMLSSSGGGCLIATATYGTELAPQVQQLREIRDTKLLKSESGILFMKSFNEFYYSFSPFIADIERENSVFKEIIRIGITPMLYSLSIISLADSDEEILGFGISVILLNIGMYFGFPITLVMILRYRLY